VSARHPHRRRRFGDEDDRRVRQELSRAADGEPARHLVGVHSDAGAGSRGRGERLGHRCERGFGSESPGRGRGLDANASRHTGEDAAEARHGDQRAGEADTMSFARTVWLAVIFLFLVSLNYTLRPVLAWRAPIDFLVIALLLVAVRTRPGAAAL